MVNYTRIFGFALLALSSAPLMAEPLAKDAIPKKVLDKFYAKHPNALDVYAAKDKHFKQEVIEIFYKDDKEQKIPHIEVYRNGGHFFINATHVIASKNASFIPESVNAHLQSAFGNYDISDAVLIPNPNGVGEEYDLLIKSNNSNWHVIIDNKGNVASKEAVK